MERFEVESSTIESIGYDRSQQILEFEFKHESIYQYYGVPEYEYNGLMGAESKGEYLAEHIKGTYRYQKIN